MNKLIVSLALAASILSGCKSIHDVRYVESMASNDGKAFTTWTDVEDQLEVYNYLRPEIKKLGSKSRVYISNSRANEIYKFVLANCDYEALSGFEPIDVSDVGLWPEERAGFDRMNEVIVYLKEHGKIDKISVEIDNKYVIVLSDLEGKHYIERLKKD